MLRVVASCTAGDVNVVLPLVYTAPESPTFFIFFAVQQKKLVRSVRKATAALIPGLTQSFGVGTRYRERGERQEQMESGWKPDPRDMRGIVRLESLTHARDERH